MFSGDPRQCFPSTYLVLNSFHVKNTLKPKLLFCIYLHVQRIFHFFLAFFDHFVSLNVARQYKLNLFIISSEDDLFIRFLGVSLTFFFFFKKY